MSRFAPVREGVLFLVGFLASSFLFLTIRQAPPACSANWPEVVTPDSSRDTQRGHQLGNNGRIPSSPLESVLTQTKTDPPFQIFVHPPANDSVARKILQTGLYEPDITQFIDRVLPKHQPGQHAVLAVDLGANVGLHALHMAGRGAHVVALEASADNARLLRASLAVNVMAFAEFHPPQQLQLTILQKGASDAATTGRMRRHPESPAFTTLSTQPLPFGLVHPAPGSVLDVDISLVRVEEELQALGFDKAWQLGMLKVDVEGFELKALRGLNLSKYPFPFIALEFFPRLLEACDTAPRELLLHLEQHQYALFTDAAMSKPLPKGEALGAWADRSAKRGAAFHVNLFARRLAQPAEK